MGFWWRLAEWLGFERPGNGPQFEIDGGSIPAEIFGLPSYQSAIGPVSAVTRREAIQVPAVKKGRDLIAGAIGTVPFRLLDTDNVEHVSTLLTQPERNRARSITMTKLVEDLLFEDHAYWWTRERNFNRFPTYVWRVDPKATIDRDGYLHVAMPDGTEAKVPPADYIVFESPTEGVLSAGARAIRTWLKLASAVDRYADSPRPQGWFTPRPEADPDQGDVQTFLDDWQKARQDGVDAYVPGVVDYHTTQWDPAQLQLVEGRKQAVIEIAECMGVDPEDLGVSTTSRTYQNGQQRRIDKINDTLGMYVSAIQDRLSMPDITPRGYRVEADFNGFLRADDLSRFQAYDLGVKLGIFDRYAVAEREGLPRPTFTMPTQPALPAPATDDANSLRQSSLETQQTEPPARHNVAFDGDSAQTFSFDTEATRTTFSVDQQSRTISGLAVPYGVVATKNGRRYQFSQGSLTWSDPSRIKLHIQHDHSQAVGKATVLDDRQDGLYATFQVARTAEGDRALVLAADGVYDGLSIGLANDAQFSERGGVHHSAPGNALREISLTPDPAFDSARVSAVVAEADSGRTEMHPEGCHCHECALPNSTTRYVAPQPPANQPPAPPQFDMGQLVQAFQAWAANQTQPPAGAGGPEVINPAEGATGVQVTEASPYRFDRSGALVKGTHDFATDLRTGMDRQNPDPAAYERALGFIQRHIFSAPITAAPQGPLDFAAVVTGDVAALNPNVQRPDLYVTQREFVFPLWEAIRKGTLDEITPMVVPKWSSHSALVAAHSQDVEPGEGTFVATSETVTPGAVSGKVRITRELWDQGGPAASAFIWQKMVYEYNKALEAIAVTELEAESPGATITVTANGSAYGSFTQAGDATSVASFESAIADLQYVATGNTFTSLALQQDLYRLFARATDTTGRKLYPMFGPVNANGQVTPRFAKMAIAGVEGYPVTSLAAPSNALSNSYLFDPESIFAVASVPQRLEFEWQVRSLELAIWGYRVVEVIDNPGIRRVAYDPGV